MLKGFISLLVQLEKQEEDYEGLENMTLHTCKLLASMEDLIISFPPKHLSVTLQPFRSQINELILPLRHSNQNPLCTSLVDDINVLGHDMFDAKLSYWRSSVSYQAFYQDLSVCSIIERCSCKNEITRSLMVAKNSQLCKKIFYSISFSSSWRRMKKSSNIFFLQTPTFLESLLLSVDLIIKPNRTHKPIPKWA